MMKPTYRFRDQVNYLSAWFKEWNDCEQTVALYSLLKRVSGPQAKFLTLVLEQTLSDSEEWSRLEQEANDPAYLSSLCNESIESAVSQLLNHLPFLTPGSNEAKAEYLSLIPKILTHSVEKGLHLEDSRQLLSYLLIHPALTNEERSSLAWWLGRLEEQTNAIGPYGTKVPLDPSPMPSPFPVDGLLSRNGLGSKPNGWRNAHHKSRDSVYNDSSTLNQLSTGSPLPHQPLTYTLSAPPAVNVTGPSNDPLGSTAGLNLPPHHRSRRSNSLTPPDSSCALSPQPYVLDWPTSPEDLEIRGNRSLSLPNEHAPLSPQSSTASSNSSTETHEDGGLPYGHPPLQKRNSFLEENSGMRDVPTWLKSLRLHKYQGLFQQMSYDEMMTLTEQDLERMNVTKGARHKIVLSVQKLKERQQLLQNLEKDIMADGSPGVLRNALNYIKNNVLITPIKPYGSTGIPDSSSMATAGFGQGLQPESPTESEQGSGTVPEGDLPAQITRFMGKMCTQLLVSRRPDEDNISLYLQLLDKSLNHESFTATQKKRLYSWRQSCQKFSRNPFPRKLSLQETKQTRPWGHYGTNFPPDYGMFPAGSAAAAAAAGGARRLARPSFSTLAQPRINPLLVSGGATTNQAGVFRPTQSSSMYVKPRPLQGNPHATVTRTKSAPIRRTTHPAGNPSPFGMPPPSQLDSQFLGEPEIMNRTESLCLSVTELALGDMDQLNETQKH